MTIPNAPLTTRDGGLGIVPPSSERVHSITGVCSGGTPNTLYAYSGPDGVAKMLTDLVGGPAVEAAVLSLFTPGNGGVVVVPVTQGVAGSNGSVTAVRDPLSGGALALSGTPKDDYDGIVKFVTQLSNATTGDGTFIYSLDGGLTWSDVYAMATSGVFVIPGTGLTITMSGGTVTPGDYWSWHSTAPGFTSGNLTAAIDALLADPTIWNFLHVVGRATSAANSATIAGVVDAKMTVAEARNRYTFAIVEAATDTDANLISSFASFASRRTMVCADYEYVTSPITGNVSKRSTAWSTAARLGSIPISQSAAAVEDGPLAFVKKVNRDENAIPGLDNARFCTHRTFNGLAGVFVGVDRMMAPAGSDFFFAPMRRVMDRASEVARLGAVRELMRKVRVNGSKVKPPLAPGAITEGEALAIEKRIGNQLRDALITPGHATEASVRLSRTANLLSNGGSDPLTLRLVAFGYLFEIPIDIGYVNPATQAA